MTRIRKRMDTYYAKGVADGAAGSVPDPFMTSEDTDYRFIRWAYDAGWREGTARRATA